MNTTTDASITPTHHERFARDGFCFVHDVLDPDWLASVRDRIDGLLAGTFDSSGMVCGAASDEGDDDPGVATRQVMSDVWPIPDPVLHALAEHPDLAVIAARLMGTGEAVIFQQQALVKAPGIVNPTPWHQDQHYYRFERPSVTIWLPLEPVDRTCGTMWLIPGTHRGPVLRHEPVAGCSKFHEITDPLPEANAVPIELAVGAISVHDKTTVHGAPANAGTRRRIAVAQHYAGLLPGESRDAIPWRLGTT